MKQWFKTFERNLKANSFFFMAFISGAVIWGTLVSSEDDLAIKYHFLFGICCVWIGVSLLGSRQDRDHKPDANS